MAKAYPAKVRERVLAMYRQGMTTAEIARIFKVSRSWARRVKQVERESGRTTPLPRGGVTVVKIDLEHLRELVTAQPDATLRELCDRLGVECSQSAVCMALQRLGLTFKKRRSMRRSRIGRTSRSVGGNGSERSRIET